MKRLLFLILLILFPFLLIAQEGSTQTTTTTVLSEKKLRIAVPELIYSNDPLNTASVFYPAFIEELKRNSGFEIVEKEEYEKLLTENKLEGSACRTAVCLGKAAKTLSLDKIVLGMITKTMERYAVEINVFDKDTNQLKSTEFFRVSSLRELKPESENAARKISAGIIVAKKGESKFDEMVRKFETKSTRIDRPGQLMKIGLGGFIGLSNLVHGYDSYLIKNIYVGAQVSLRSYDKGRISDLTFGFVFDEIPLTLPEGTYGQTEDLASLTGFLHYSPLTVAMLNPYIGIGLGGYFDYVTLDSPASGYMSSMYFFMGFNLIVGFELRVNDLITLFGEAKYHFIWEPGKGGMFLANHLTAGGGVTFFLF